MKNWLKKLQFKGFIAGVLVTAMLSGTFVMANPVMREVIFGVSIRVNGALQEFDADSRPFSMDGRTFLPVRAVADMFGAEVGFDAATNTVLLTGDIGAAATNAPTPLGNTMFEYTASYANTLERAPAVNIMGNAHLDALLYSGVAGGVSTRDFTTRHNLGGNYARLTGIYGIVDGSERPGNFRLTITGDGRQLLDELIMRDDAPLRLDLDVSDIEMLTIRVLWSQWNPAQVALSAQLHR